MLFCRLLLLLLFFQNQLVQNVVEEYHLSVIQFAEVLSRQHKVYKN